MMKTIYRTARPQDVVNTGRPEDFTNAEFRQVLVNQLGDHPLDPYVVKVKQAWWDDAAKQPINETTLFEKQFNSWQEARACYEENIQHLVAEGYVHSFSVDPLADEGRRYDYERLAAE